MGRLKESPGNMNFTWDRVATSQTVRVVLTGVMVTAGGLFLASCNLSKNNDTTSKAEINNETKFSAAEYGVDGSPRVTTKKGVPKGGGYYKVGKPYTIRGKTYHPRLDPGYVKTGMASWYGPNFHGRITANGEVYDQYALSAAHPTMPLPSYARVTNLENGSSVVVRVNDRGPYAHDRIIDLSSQAANLLGYKRNGVANVKIEYVGKARMDGLDQEVLMASYSPNGVKPFGSPSLSRPQIYLADSTGVRTALDQIQTNATTSSALVPVPTSRPATYHGIPMPLDVFMVKQRSGLLSGYTADDAINLRVKQAFEFIDSGSKFSTNKKNTVHAQSEIRAPDMGMQDIVQLRYGPYDSDDKLYQAEEELSQFGLTARHGNNVVLIVAKEEANIIFEEISKAGLAIK